VEQTAPLKELKHICCEALKNKREIHFLPPYRSDIMILIY